MVPTEVHAVARLPLTVNGKVDRQALLDGLHQTSTAEQVERRDDSLEETIGRIWAEELRVQNVQPDDDFFALGGHSLLVLNVVGRTREAAGVNLRVSELFAAPRLSDFVARVRAADKQPRRRS
jgi:acyl carrier protein